MTLLGLMMVSAVTAMADNYPLAFPKDAARNHSRELKGIGLASQYISFGDTKKMYADQTRHSFIVKAGATVDPSVTFPTWMNGYVYIDRNHNGRFDVQTPGAKGHLDETNELVSFSGLTLSDGKYNSAGTALNQLSAVDPPAFTAPTEPGFYYMRYKIDWDSSLPEGRMDTENGIIKNGGAIMDVRLRVYGDDSIAHISTVSPHGQVVDGSDKALSTMQLKLGTPFIVSIRPESGYQVKSVSVRHGNLKGDSIAQNVAQYATEVFSAQELNYGLLSIPGTLVDGDVEISVDYEAATGAQAPTYQMVFSDEFDTDGTPNPDKWVTSQRNTATWNRFVTDADSLAYVKNGSLVLRCVKNGKSTGEADKMVSGAKETQGKFSFTYGKVDIRMKTKKHTGNFPAAWMMPHPPRKGWPNSGEIDIFEAIDNQDIAYHTVHSHWTWDLGKKGDPQSSANEACSVEDWHVYGLEWDSKEIRWYLDGRKVFTYTKNGDNNSRQNNQWPFDHPFYIILNQSVGSGSWAKNPDVNFEYVSEVDYVRVWQLKNADGSDFVPFDTLTSAKPEATTFAPDTRWRQLTVGANRFVMTYEKDNTPINLQSRITSKEDGHLWCIVKTGKGLYRIYNKLAGPEKILVAPKTVGSDNGLNMTPMMVNAASVDTTQYTTEWTPEDVTTLSGENGFLLKQHGTGYAMNKRGQKLAFWTTGADAGSTFLMNDRYNDVTGYAVFNNATASLPYRIPALAETRDGKLIASADYRYGKGDIGSGKISNAVRISSDYGKTWTEQRFSVQGVDGNNAKLAYGDPAIVADSLSDNVLIAFATGNTSYWNSTLTSKIGVAFVRSNDGGVTWQQPEDKTQQIYNLYSSLTTGSTKAGLFLTSGKIMQSRYIKKNGHYRLYIAHPLTYTKDSKQTTVTYVIYSDDFGNTWQVLGGLTQPASTAGDESKVEELPNGNVLLSCRNFQGGRKFNVFTYTNANAATGQWSQDAMSDIMGQGKVNNCNGEIIIVPARRISDGEQLYVALQSVPQSASREKVGFYYKELATAADYESGQAAAANWKQGLQASRITSCYSTMLLLRNKKIGFLFEEGFTGTELPSNNGYDIMYRDYSLEEITNGEYSVSPIGQVSGISSVETEATKAESTQWYDLSGRRAIARGKGIFISNGKKIYIK